MSMRWTPELERDLARMVDAVETEPERRTWEVSLGMLVSLWIEVLILWTAVNAAAMVLWVGFCWKGGR